ncbi:MAG: signal peptidase I [Promicromonosporaceae bacterium]|nr:signal peptidase I [Promicromonosporaceae bacterium]
MRRTVAFLGRVLATVVVIVAGAALVVGVLVPRVAGATPYAVLTGSMAPALPVGSLAVVRPREHIQVGDVITYQLRSGEPEVVTHRVVGLGVTTGGERRYTTKGDANPIADTLRVAPVQVRGVVWYHVPYLGYVAAWLGGQDRQWIAVAIAALLVAYAAWQVTQSVRERRQRAQKPAAVPGPGTDAGEPRPEEVEAT